MKKFNSLSIRAKLILIILAVSLATVLLISGTHIAWDAHQERQTAEQELSALARLIGNRSTAALAFDDASQATENLDSLNAMSQVMHACLYRINGSIMANYQRNQTNTTACPPFQQLLSTRTHQVSNSLHIVSKIRQGSQPLGWIYIRSDLSLIEARLKNQFTFSGIALLAAALLSWLLAGWMQRFISKPIASVTNVAKAIEENGDHNLRANVVNNDEIGQLARTFNAMLDGLDSQNKQLVAAKDKQIEASTLYRSLVESTSAIPWELDLATWRFIFVGHQAESVFGYPIEDWYQEGFWTEHLHPDDIEKSMNYCQSATDLQQDHQFEYRMLAADGRMIWIHDDVQVVVKDDKPVRLQGFMFDISERKQMEDQVHRHRDELENVVEQRTAELSSANKELESFGYSVSHDLRAPLRSITGFSQMLLDDYTKVLDEEGQDLLTRVINNANRMSTLIDDLLGLSRLGRKKLHAVKVDFDKLIADEVKLLQEGNDRKVDFIYSPLGTVVADEGLLKVAIDNLLENAWKYTSKSDNARVEVGKKTINGETVFFVKDNGAGFNMAQVDKIFSPFQRLHKKEEFEGSGIGLATVQRIIHRHGGRIWAEAEPEKGAAFFFTLPET